MLEDDALARAEGAYGGPPNPRDPERKSGGPYRTEVINGIQYTYDRNGNLVDVRAVPGAGAAGGGGGARGATPEELALSYARLEQDQRQWEAELLAAQAKGDADRAQRAQEHLDNLAAQRDELDRKYADAAAGREWQGRENEFDRDFQAARDAARYEFEGAEADKNRALDQFMQDDQQAFLGGENAADRSLRLQLQANELGFSREELAFEKERFAATHELNKARFGLEKQRAGLQAARQFADVISSTDPAALDAFLAAGGGNISNALAGGQTALSENALLPGAMTLRTAREMGAPIGVGLEGAGLYNAPAGGGYAPGGGASSAADFMAQRAAANAGLGSGTVTPTGPAPVAGQSGQKQLYEGGDYVPRRFIPAQGGFEGVVDRPTMFLTGEKPQRVEVQPLGRGAPQTSSEGAANIPATAPAPTGRAALTDVMRPEVRARGGDFEARRAAAAERLRQMLQQAASGYGGGEGFMYAGGPSPRFGQDGGEVQPQTAPVIQRPQVLPPGVVAPTRADIEQQLANLLGIGGYYPRGLPTAEPDLMTLVGQRQYLEQARAARTPQPAAAGTGVTPPATPLDAFAGGPEREQQVAAYGLEQIPALNLNRPIFAQRGFRGVMTQPTPVVAAEGYQPERVSIQNVGGAQAGAAPIGAGPTQGDGLPALLGQYRPELEEVRRLREGVQFGQINPFDVKSRLIDPVLWERFLRGRQTKYGIPVRSQVHEVNRYQLAGARRGTRQGY